MAERRTAPGNGVPFRAAAGGGGVPSRDGTGETCYHRSALESAHIIIQPAKHGEGCHLTSLPVHLI